MKTLKLTLLLIIISAFAFTSCSQPRTVIAISKGHGSESYKMYEKWLKRNTDEKIKTIDLYGLDFDRAVEIVKTSHGFLLTGGPDVHPAFYGKGYDTARCSIDNYRDTLEFAIISAAYDMNIPILGICRGMQILNIAKGGSLVVDIPEDWDNPSVHQIKGEDAEHPVIVERGSFLEALTGVREETVNSNHHQAIDKLADDFMPTAFAPDGVIEAFELRDKRQFPFLLAVGWHPERLPRGHPMSDPIAKEFLTNAHLYKRFLIEMQEQNKTAGAK